MDVLEVPLEVKGLDQRDLLDKMPVHEADDLIANAVITVVLSCTKSIDQVLLEQVRCDMNEPFFGLLFKPSDPWSEPVPVILESFWLAARMAHLCIVNRVVSNRWLKYKQDSK